MTNRGKGNWVIRRFGTLFGAAAVFFLPVCTETAYADGYAEAATTTTVMTVSECDGQALPSGAYLYLVESTADGDRDSEGYGPEAEDYEAGEGYERFSAYMTKKVAALLDETVNEAEVMDLQDMYIYRPILTDAAGSLVEGNLSYQVSVTNAVIYAAYESGEYEPMVCEVTADAKMNRLPFTYQLKDGEIIYNFTSDCSDLVILPMQAGWTGHLLVPDEEPLAVRIAEEAADTEPAEEEKQETDQAEETEETETENQEKEEETQESFGGAENADGQMEEGEDSTGEMTDPNAISSGEEVQDVSAEEKTGEQEAKECKTPKTGDGRPLFLFCGFTALLLGAGFLWIRRGKKKIS